MPFGLVLAGILVTASFFFPVIPRTNEPMVAPLKVVANARGIDVGNFAIRNYLQDSQYAGILTSHFNVALLDNTPNWYFTDGGLRPSKETFFFDHMDEVMAFAENNNMATQAHHLLWGEQKWLPDWLKNGQFSKDELYDIVHTHIDTVGKRYSGRIQEWTVVNEAFSRGQHVNDLSDWWADAFGNKDYIDHAFQWARQADPYAKLILNDFGNETENAISDEMYTYIADALDRGIPIDGIGMQMHIDGTNPPTKEAVVRNMERFGNLGITVYVTEFDVNMSAVSGSHVVRDQVQAQIYYDMARACIESMVCKSFSVLGITDKETWYSYLGYEHSDPLPFDQNYKPKPAFYALYDAFRQ